MYTKIYKLDFFIYFKKKLIVIREKINEKKIEIKLSNEKLKSFEEIKFVKPNIETAPSVGIDKRKDIFTASNLLKFKNLAAVIEIPDLLTPGIKESI